MTTPPCKVLTSSYRPDVPSTRPAPQYPEKGVRGEIKPHNTAGIRAGVKQLRVSKSPGKRLLLTYRPVSPGDPSTYEVLMAAPSQLEAAIANPQKDIKLTTWYRIGQFSEPCALRPIAFHTCPTLLGAQVEQSVRNTYQTYMRKRWSAFSLPPKAASAKGHDVLHEELADFLAELAVQVGAA